MLPHFFQTPWRLSNIINAFPQGSRCFGLSTWCSCSPCWCALFLVSCGRRRSQFFLLRIVDDKMLQVETGWMFPWFWKMPNCSNSRGFIGRWTDISSVSNAQGITGLAIKASGGRGRWPLHKALFVWGLRQDFHEKILPEEPSKKGSEKWTTKRPTQPKACSISLKTSSMDLVESGKSGKPETIDLCP